MRIQVDRNRCVGSGMCAFTAPDVFTQDDEGVSEVLPGHELDGEKPVVSEAAQACPVQAIEVDGS
ncbi:ferredoxin [Streptomyces sp. NPDC005438]|uniref:ferredoxin n=1 Tax=Streptomyces sp. NPDC005438 TaxID=3156880 RepID=UPI0033A69E67